MAGNSGVIDSWNHSCFSKLNFFLLILASVAIWLWSDALTVEVPFLVPFLPEGWRLGSFLVLMKGLSTASLLLLPLFLMKGIIPACISCFGLGFLFSISIYFFWDHKIGPTRFFPKGLSIGFLANAFCLMGLDSVRMTLVYMLATSMFSESYITAVLIGDACGGLFASGVSYIQGYKQFKPGTSNIPILTFSSFATNASGATMSPVEFQSLISKDFAFGPQTALLFLGILYFLCFASLGILIYQNRRQTTNRAKYESISEECHTDNSETSPLHSADRSTRNSMSDNDILNPNMERSSERSRLESETELRIVRSVQEVSIVKWYYRDMYSDRHKYFLWFTWFVASGSVFTLMPAFHSYSTLPYSQRCFMLAVSFWSLSFPLTAIFAHFVRLRKLVSLTITLVFHFAICGMLISIAAQSPHPPFVGTSYAEPVIILIWVAQGSSGFFLFCTASYCLRELDENAVKWGSIAAQVGDVAGSFLSFALVNFSNCFVEPNHNSSY
ncbi:riboflavin transporter 2-like [Convolutriloba macropyga]|uniref:riboflavin transporter 2-like n=1 Tax=Convolutriloba macropyga TaxID=536237 RepID=UPI003F5223C1